MTHIETIEERIRNSVGPFVMIRDLVQILQKEKDNKEDVEKFINLLLNEELVENLEHSINYLIKLGEVVDKHLPDNFNINEIISKENGEPVQPRQDDNIHS